MDKNSLETVWGVDKLPNGGFLISSISTNGTLYFETTYDEDKKDWVTNAFREYPRFNICPNCGAKIDGAK